MSGREFFARYAKKWSEATLAKAFFAHQLYDAAVVARVGLERFHRILFAGALELHQRRRTAVVCAWSSGAPIYLEYDRNRMLAGDSEPANANRGAMR